MVDRQGDWYKRMYYSYPFYRPLGMYLPTKVSGVSIGKTYGSLFEPALEIMVLFVLRKFILQTRMRSHPVGLDVWF